MTPGSAALISAARLRPAAVLNGVGDIHADSGPLAGIL